MKYYIFTLLSALMLFSSCADEELDRFAIDDISINITQSWDDKNPRFDVKVSNEQNQNIGKVMLRLFYHDQTAQSDYEGDCKDIELKGSDGNYSYTANDFPNAFAGDTYKAYAFTEIDGYMITSEKLEMIVPGDHTPIVTSGTFVFYEQSAEHPYYGEGEIHLTGSNFSRHLYVSEYDQTSSYLMIPENVLCDVSSDEAIIRGCTVNCYGENEVVIRQLGKSYTFNFDVPGLKIESFDKRYASLGQTITMKVSGMKSECTYEIYDAKIVSAADDEIKFIPNQYWQNQKVKLIEKHHRDAVYDAMYCFSNDRITVR